MVTPGRRVALVTGANRGIGLEIARELGRCGMTVLVGARSEDQGARAASELRTSGVDARAVPLDVTDDRSVTDAADWITGELDVLDVLVNNAAVAHDLTAKGMDLSMHLVRETFDTNVLGVIRVTQAMLPLLHRSSAPRIVNLSSGLGSLARASASVAAGRPLPLVYAASKAALNAVTLSYAAQLASRGFKVNAVSPGRCATGMTRYQAPRPASEGASVAVRMAMLPDDGPTGTFVGHDGPIDW